MFAWLKRPVLALLRFARSGRPRPDPGADRLGPKSEHLARAFLERAGLSILAANFRCPLGELDLVARDGDTLVFVEVKARTRSADSRPEQAVTRSKQKRIGRAARYFCKTHGGLGAAVRFDVIAVEWPAGADPAVRHHVAAFRPDV